MTALARGSSSFGLALAKNLGRAISELKAALRAPATRVKLALMPDLRRAPSWVLVAALLAVGCGSDTTPASNAGCKRLDVVLTGSLDSASLSFDAPYTGFSWNRPAPGVGKFDASFGGELHLTGSNISDGASGAIQGSIVMPDGTPHAGETLCVGAGSTFSPCSLTTPTPACSVERYVFHLRGLAAGASCDQPLDGKIDGCLQSDLP